MCNSGPPEMYDLKCKSIFFEFHVGLKIQFFQNMTFCKLINKGKQYNAEGEGVHF